MTMRGVKTQATNVMGRYEARRKKRVTCGGLRRPAWSDFGRGFTDELDVVRWRPQREVVRDILLSAAECGAWLTLEELRGMTRFPAASIGAHVRALRTAAGGGFVVGRRRRAVRRLPRIGDAGDQDVLGAFEYRIERRVG